MSRLDARVHEANRRAMAIHNEGRSAREAMDQHSKQIGLWLRSRPEVGETRHYFYIVDSATRATKIIPAFS